MKKNPTYLRSFFTAIAKMVGVSSCTTHHSPLTTHHSPLTLSTLFALSSLFISCSNINCPVQNTVALRCSIADTEGNEAKLADTLWVWTQRSDGNDTLLNRWVGPANFSLPISYSHPEDVLIFFVGSLSNTWTLDTLWLQKNDIPHFESVDCAAHFFHDLTAVRSTHQGIDSVYINQQRVDYDPQRTNLIIRFKNVSHE
jgi:hypothetical protein